jgi:hypothetical protein
MADDTNHPRPRPAGEQPEEYLAALGVRVRDLLPSLYGDGSGSSKSLVVSSSGTRPIIALSPAR